MIDNVLLKSIITSFKVTLLLIFCTLFLLQNLPTEPVDNSVEITLENNIFP